MNATHEAACARVTAHFRPRWLRHYVANKLRHDRVFAATFELLRESNEPILDVGCGVGLLPFYLRERGLQQAIVALDIDARKLEHARAIARHYDNIEFLEQDGSDELPEFCGIVTLFDVLHYLAPARQTKMLRAIALRVAPEGALLIRDCPRDRSARFWATYFAERFAQTISWNIAAPLHFPTREQLEVAFSADEFTGDEQPMHGSGPFNNRLFVFKPRAFAVVPAAG